MTSTLHKLTTINQLAPNASTIHHWNNATPSSAVWYIQAVPLTSSLVPTATVQSVIVEVPRVWRRLNLKNVVIGEIPTTEIEHEVWYEVKNIGTKPVNVDVYASVIS